ncbi:MAG: hypothetical protein ACRCXC_02050 [Legionella sp.]
MYPALVNQLKEKLISELQPELQQAWMTAKASEIQQEVTEEKTSNELNGLEEIRSYSLEKTKSW